jgi:low temperature requirement protein LtrA
VALNRWRPPVVRHSLASEEGVSWVELFFDLIFVAALIQLGDELADDVSLAGAARFAAAFFVLWWTWTGTTLVMNRFAVDDVPHRVLVVVQMFAVGNFALVVVAPVDDRSTWIVVAYLATRLPLLAMYARARHHVPEARGMIDVHLRWFGVGATIWLLSLLLPEPARYWAWGVGVAAELLAPVLVARLPDAVPTHDEHLRERFALFTIIVLGESFVKVLTELADTGIDLDTEVLGALLFATSVGMWWTYFDDVADSEIRRRSALAARPSVNRVWWVFAHLPLAMALTAFGVSAKKAVVVEGLATPLPEGYLTLLTGSVAMVLVATALLDAVTASPHHAIDERWRVLPRLGAAAAVLAVRVFPDAGVGAVLGGITAIVAAQIAIEVVVASRADRVVEARVSSMVDALRGSCVHIESSSYTPPSERVCRECLDLDLTWVRLRMCLACGHVGCCDDSPARHTRQHQHATGHPTIVGIEEGEEWSYCFVDGVIDPGWLRTR